MDKAKELLLRTAFNTARGLRDVAARLETAARACDFEQLAEIGPPKGVWTVDQIKGAARVLARADMETRFLQSVRVKDFVEEGTRRGVSVASRGAVPPAVDHFDNGEPTAQLRCLVVEGAPSWPGSSLRKIDLDAPVDVDAFMGDGTVLVRPSDLSFESSLESVDTDAALEGAQDLAADPPALPLSTRVSSRAGVEESSRMENTPRRVTVAYDAASFRARFGGALRTQE